MDRDEEQLADDGGMDEDARLETEAADTEETDAAGDDGRTEIEAEARKHGWKPQGDWKGDKTNWVDADRYLERLKPASLHDRLERTSKELAEIKRQREQEKRDFEDRLDRAAKMGQKALERQRQQLLVQAKANQRAAAEAGDMEAFDAWQDREAQIAEDLAKEDRELAPAPKRQAEVAFDPTIASWVQQNLAVRHDPKKWAAAVDFFTEAEHQLPNGTIADHLAHVEERLAEIWPGAVKRRAKASGKANGHDDEGDDEPRARVPQTERSGRMAARQARAKGWAEIPAEEKKIYKDYIAEGLFKDEADAAKAHWS